MDSGPLTLNDLEQVRSVCFASLASVFWSYSSTGQMLSADKMIRLIDRVTLAGEMTPANKQVLVAYARQGRYAKTVLPMAEQQYQRVLNFLQDGNVFT